MSVKALLIIAALPVAFVAFWWDQLLAMFLERRMRRSDDRPARRRPKP
jgi:hypothetical protein